MTIGWQTRCPRGHSSIAHRHAGYAESEYYCRGCYEAGEDPHYDRADIERAPAPKHDATHGEIWTPTD